MNYKKIYYWSPSFVNIATNRAVINSSYSVSKYNHDFKASIINFFGEFTKYKSELNNKKIETIGFFNPKIINFFPKHGKFNSRLSYVIIFALLSYYILIGSKYDRKSVYDRVDKIVQSSITNHWFTNSA